MQMTPTLERLAELVRQAESKARAQRLGGDVRQAGEVLRVAETRANEAQRRLREDRPVRLRELKQAVDEDKLLREMTISWPSARAISSRTTRRVGWSSRPGRRSRSSGPMRRRTSTRSSARPPSRRRPSRSALDKYTELRKELDRLLPQLAGDYADTDRLVSGVARLFPSSQIPELSKEIEDGSVHFGVLEAREQKAQLMIWIGRLQAAPGDGLRRGGRGDGQALELIFRRLVGLSKQYMPGYIDAFQEGYVADWDQYIVDAQEQFPGGRRGLGSENERLKAAREEQVQPRPGEEEPFAANSTATRSAISAPSSPPTTSPDEGLDAFLMPSSRRWSTTAARSEQRSCSTWSSPTESRSPGATSASSASTSTAIKEDESRKRLEDRFALREQVRRADRPDPGSKGPHDRGGRPARMPAGPSTSSSSSTSSSGSPTRRTRPALLKSLEERVKNRGVDILLILKEYVAHHIPERLRPLCQENGIPCLMVEHGYGANQVAEALRNGLKPLGPGPEEVR